MSRKKPDFDMIARHRLVRTAIVAGVPYADIIRQLTVGFAVGQHVIKVSEATARRDIKAIEAEFAGLFTSEQAADTEIGVAFQTYKEIAKAAMGGPKPQFHAALTAVDRVVRIAASASSRWRHLAGHFAPRLADEDNDSEIDAAALERLNELKQLPDDELIKRHRRLEERAARLGLTVQTGGRSSTGG